MKINNVYGLAIRYLLLLVLGAFNLWLFYIIFTPLTVGPVFFFISLFEGNARLLEGNVLFFSRFYAEIIPACVAGAAYYLLLILNLTTPMDFRKRIKSVSFLLGLFLILNIARILIFSGLLVSGYQYFDFAHRFTWYFGSTVLVIAIWFVNVWVFKINGIPIYSDVKNIFNDILRKDVKDVR